MRMIDADKLLRSLKRLAEKPPVRDTLRDSVAAKAAIVAMIHYIDEEAKEHGTQI